MFRLQSIALMVLLIALFAIVADSLIGTPGALLVIGLSLALNWVSLDRAAGLILRLHRARPLEGWETPRLFQLAERLSRRAKIPFPHLMLYPGQAPNAFAMGAGSGRGFVAVSTGLLQLLDLREATGVLAHEFAHLKNGDSKLNVVAGIFVQATTVASQLVGFGLLFLFLTGGVVNLPALPIFLIVALAPAAATLLQAAIMRTRERLADRDAAALSGDARGLASALYKLQQYSEHMERWRRRFRCLYTANSEKRPALLRTHPHVEERIEALLRLERRR